MRARLRWTAALAAAFVPALAATIALGVVTVPVGDFEPNDDIAVSQGLPTAPTFDGSLTETDVVDATTGKPKGDWNDVYRVSLGFNERLDVTMTSSYPAWDLDMWLWRPGVSTVNVDEPAGLVYAGSERENAVDSFSFVCQAPYRATWYLDVWMFRAALSGGIAPYRITYSKVQLPTPGITAAAPTTVSHYAETPVTGVVASASAPVAGRQVVVQSRAPKTTTWGGAAVATTTADGSFRAVVRPYATREYRVMVRPTAVSGWSFSATRTITPRAYLPTPTVPTTAYRYRAFTIKGLIRPAHASGLRHVRLDAYHYESGRWVYRRTGWARTSYRTVYTSAYSGSIMLPYRGRWRIRAYVPSTCGLHATSVSAFRNVTVR